MPAKSPDQPEADAPRCDVATLGHVLAERYLIEQLVGQGTFGRVFRARDLVTGERVALKEFMRQAGKSDGFLRELGVLFELKHHAIIDCASLVMRGPFRYLVCEFMEAGSLRDRLEDASQSVTTLLRLLSQATEGVSRAHACNIIHRDLKPENVLLTRRGGELRAKVSDFGVSTLGTAMGVRSCIGSPAYMAPEQFYDQYDARVDVYALGVMLFEILCGRRPFIGSPAQLMASHIKHEAELPAWLPRSFARVLKKSLAKKPEKRFASADLFRAALDLALAAEGDALKREGWPFAGGRVLALAQTRDELLVRQAGALLRLDRHGRLIQELPAVDEVLAARSFALLRRGDIVAVRGASRAHVLKAVPPGATIALSAEGDVALLDGGRVTVKTPRGQESVTSEGSGVTAVTFVGAEQMLCVARLLDGRARVEFGGTSIELPECVDRLYGHPTRHEIVARTSSDPGRLQLIRLGRVSSVQLQCGPLSCDGESFHAVTPDGSLATLNVASTRVARTRWESSLVAVAAGEDRISCATATGKIVSLS